MRRHYVRNSAQEAEQFRSRAALGFLAVAFALCGLATWYFKLQVLDHTDYAKRSQDNRVKITSCFLYVSEYFNNIAHHFVSLFTTWRNVFNSNEPL